MFCMFLEQGPGPDSWSARSPNSGAAPEMVLELRVSHFELGVCTPCPYLHSRFKKGELQKLFDEREIKYGNYIRVYTCP